MNVEQQDAETKKSLYLQRVNQLYVKIGNWLQDEPLIDVEYVIKMGKLIFTIAFSGQNAVHN